MTVKIFSAILRGWQAIPVTISISCEEGNGISISGLITRSIHRDMSRLQFALINCGLGFKRKKLSIEIEPAIFDEADCLMLAIAIGILIATGTINSVMPMRNYLIVGGLGVTGNVHEIDGAASIAKMAKDMGFKKIILPASNIKVLNFDYPEGIYPFGHLNMLANFLQNEELHKKVESLLALFDHLNFN
jgi:magnesium chelatase family protein